MTEHKWKTEEADAGGGIGWYDFTYCTECGAHRSPLGFASPTPFFPGPALKVGFDCIEAKKIIEEYKAKCDIEAAKAVEFWNAADEGIKNPIHEFLGWKLSEYEEFLKTKKPPYTLFWGYYNAPSRLFKCTDTCLSCCIKDED